eukprot:scaffold149732_cov31-Prasinocladus_malaysianus.AAC.2
MAPAVGGGVRYGWGGGCVMATNFTNPYRSRLKIYEHDGELSFSSYKAVFLRTSSARAVCKRYVPTLPCIYVYVTSASAAACRRPDFLSNTFRTTASQRFPTDL